MSASRAALLTVVATILAAPPVGAADVTDVVVGVRVAAPSCPISPLSVPAFVEALRVELAARAPRPGATLVTLAIEPCDTATTRVHVALTSEGVGPVADREVGLEDIALEARPRALALVVAELVRGAPSPSAPAPPPPVPAAPQQPPPDAAATTTLAAEALLNLFPNRDTALWGGRLSVSRDRPRWSLGVFGEGALGGHDYDDGRVAVQCFGVGLLAGPRWVSGRVTLAPGLVGAVGWTRIQGHADAPDVAARAGSGLTVALRARLAASVVFVRVASVRAFVEAGWMARGYDATVDGTRAAGASGATLAFGLGLAF
jgi:hypothetical protein